MDLPLLDLRGAVFFAFGHMLGIEYKQPGSLKILASSNCAYCDNISLGFPGFDRTSFSIARATCSERILEFLTPLHGLSNSPELFKS